MKLFSVALLAFTLAAPMAFAHEHCNCDKKCETSCKDHKAKDCKCDNCECSKTGHCKHDHCNMDHHKMNHEKMDHEKTEVSPAPAKQ